MDDKPSTSLRNAVPIGDNPPLNKSSEEVTTSLPTSSDFQTTTSTSDLPHTSESELTLGIRKEQLQMEVHLLRLQLKQRELQFQFLQQDHKRELELERAKQRHGPPEELTKQYVAEIDRLTGEEAKLRARVNELIAICDTLLDQQHDRQRQSLGDNEVDPLKSKMLRHIEQVRGRNMDLEKEMRERKQKIIDLESQLLKAHHERALAETESEFISDQNHDLQKQVEILNQQLNSHRDIPVVMERPTKDITADRERHLEAELNKRLKQIGNLQKELVEREQSHNRCVLQLNSDLRTMSLERDGRSQLCTQLTATIKQLTGDNEKLLIRGQELKMEISTVKRQNAAEKALLLSECDNLKEKTAKLADTHQGLMELLSETDTANQDSGSKAVSPRIVVVLMKLQHQNNELCERVESLESQLNAKIQQLKNLKEVNRLSGQPNEKLVLEVANKNNLLAEMEQRVSDFDTILADRDNTMALLAEMSRDMETLLTQNKDIAAIKESMQAQF